MSVPPPPPEPRLSRAGGRAEDREDAADPDHTEDTGRLLERARRGSRSAVEALFRRHAPWLRRAARGRLPRFARAVVDTSDLVQDVLHRTFTRLNRFEPRHEGAFRAYLRRAVENRIRDEMRRAVRWPETVEVDERVRSTGGAPQHQQILDDETWRRYLEGLKRLSPRDRRLVAGRVEHGYTYKQLALVEDLSNEDAARMAVRRAVERLSRVMPDA